MATVALAKLSGSTDGRPMAVVATATPGTTIHTAGAVTGDDNYDLVDLEATNVDTVERLLTLEWGGTTTADQILHKVPAQSTIRVTAGKPLQNALVVKAFADAASKINLSGLVRKYRA